MKQYKQRIYKYIAKVPQAKEPTKVLSKYLKG